MSVCMQGGETGYGTHYSYLHYGGTQVTQLLYEQDLDVGEQGRQRLVRRVAVRLG